MTACDSHVHIVAEAAQRPMAAGRRYTPAPASVKTLMERSAREGIEHFVVVQPSFYGADNTVLIEALGALGGRGRGVAVLDPEQARPEDVAGLGAAGVRGLRLNLYSPDAGTLGGGLDDRFAATAALAARAGWHVEVLADLPVLLAAADLLAGSPAPVVVDHYGLPGSVAPTGPEGRRWLELARRDHVWVKLSAPYRLGPDPLAASPDRRWLDALLDAASDRCLWGSDWPHTPAHADQPGDGGSAPYRALDYGTLLRAFRAALPSAAMAERILSSNPTRLYGFPP